jgi:phage shock protein A
MSDDDATRPQPPVPPEAGLGADYTEDGVPTFEHVRDRIEGRYATAAGAAELAGEPASIDEQFADRDRAARDRLDEIRRSLRGE